MSRQLRERSFSVGEVHVRIMLFASAESAEIFAGFRHLIVEEPNIDPLRWGHTHLDIQVNDDGLEIAVSSETVEL